MQNRVNQALGRMPAEVRTNGISVHEEHGRVPRRHRVLLGRTTGTTRCSSRNYLDLYVRDAFKRVPGVGNVIIFGERKFAMRLWLDPDKLAGRGLTPGDVVNALREQNVQVAAGSVGDSPSAADQMYQLSVRAAGRLTEVPQFEDVVVKAGPRRRARARAGHRPRRAGRRELLVAPAVRRRRSVGHRHPAAADGQRDSRSFTGVQEELDAAASRTFRRASKAQIAFDNVVVVQESIIEVLKTLAEAILLVVLVMFLFLQNWRSTMIPAITIPVSLIGTFAFVKLFGFSINTLTLFGIVLATGIVVDDAIVVIENVERHMREYRKSAHVAAVDAMREVFSAVVVIGIVLVAVFVPVAFFPGTTGRMYQQFSLTIAFSVVLSVFNAVTFTPALSALLLDRHNPKQGRFFTWVNRVIDGGTNLYVRIDSRGCCAGSWRCWRCSRSGSWATWQIYQLVPSSFVPDEDEGYFIAIIQAPSGASLEYTMNIAKQAEQIIMKQPEVLAVFSVGGFSFSGSAPNQGLMFARLRPYDERTTAGASRSAAVLDRLRGPAASAGITGALVLPFAPPAIQGLQVVRRIPVRGARRVGRRHQQPRQRDLRR